MFVVCGEALMDVFGQGHTPTGMALDARIGGSPFNVARGLARLAQPVAFFGGVSNGFLGERLMSALQQEGIDTGCVVRLDAPTTLSLVGLDASGVPSYSFYGEACADRLVPLSALERVPSTAKVLHFGSYAMVVDPVAQTQRALIEREHGRVLISYDPNVRLNVEPDLSTWREALNWMVPRTTLLKISAEDIELLAPHESVEELATLWVAQGVSLVVVTRGADGAWAWTARHHVSVEAKPCEMVDTVGAGDTFQAALLTWLAEHDALSAADIQAMHALQLKDALDFAAAAAAITCSRRGADLPRRTDFG